MKAIDKNRKERTKLEGELTAADKNGDKVISDNSVDRILKEKRMRELMREKRDLQHSGGAVKK